MKQRRIKLNQSEIDIIYQALKYIEGAGVELPDIRTYDFSRVRRRFWALSSMGQKEYPGYFVRERVK